jgi:hypothetical protein
MGCHWKYHDYLYGKTFTVLTENNPLTYILISANLDATGHRWIDALTSYNFNSMYIPGSSNAYADGLSRLPGLLGKSVSNISTESVKAICNIQHVQHYAQCLSLSVTTADEPSLPKRHLVDVNFKQKSDNCMKEWTYPVLGRGTSTANERTIWKKSTQHMVHQQLREVQTDWWNTS